MDENWVRYYIVSPKFGVSLLFPVRYVYLIWNLFVNESDEKILTLEKISNGNSDEWWWNDTKKSDSCLYINSPPYVGMWKM